MLTSLLAAATLAAADSTVYPVLNHDRSAGSMVVTRNGDSITVRYVFTDRNRGTRVHWRYLVRHGRTLSAELRPVLPDDRLGDPTARTEIFGDSIRRWSPTSSTTERLQPDVYYTFGGTPYEQALLAKHVLRQPQRTAKLPNNNSIRAEIVKEATVTTSRGKERVRLVSLDRGVGASPQLVWLDASDNLFATEVSWFITVKPGAESALATLRKLEIEYRDAQAGALNKRLMRATNGTIAIKNGDLFDSDRGVVRPRTTVLVRGDRIVAVGPSDSVAIPAGATVIDATGKTIMPGMWEMHAHFQLTSENSGSAIQLSHGITTVRDVAADIDVAVSQRDRAQAGKI